MEKTRLPKLTFMFIQMDFAKRKGTHLTFPPKIPPPVSASQVSFHRAGKAESLNWSGFECIRH